MSGRRCPDDLFEKDCPVDPSTAELRVGGSSSRVLPPVQRSRIRGESDRCGAETGSRRASRRWGLLADSSLADDQNHSHKHPKPTTATPHTDRQAGYPQCVSPVSMVSYNEHYSGGYVGGGKALGGHERCVLDGTWGWDYSPFHPMSSRIFLKWSRGPSLPGRGRPVRDRRTQAARAHHRDDPRPLWSRGLTEPPGSGRITTFRVISLQSVHDDVTTRRSEPRWPAMTPAFQLRVIDEDRLPVFTSDYTKRVEIGRQDRGEPGPYSQWSEPDRWRLVIAELNEDTVSRHHLLLEPLSEFRFRAKNISETIAIRLGTGKLLNPKGGELDLPIPSQLMLGKKLLCVVATESNSDQHNELPEATLPPGTFENLATRMGAMNLLEPKGTDPAGMVRWLRAAMEVLQAAATSTDFFEKAAHAAAELVGLDSASVWLLKDDQWVVEAEQVSPRLPAVPKSPASRVVLNKVRQRAKTLWDKPEANASATTSLESVASVVAAPILNRQGEVIGASLRRPGVPRPAQPSAWATSRRSRPCSSSSWPAESPPGSNGLKTGSKPPSPLESSFQQFFTRDLAKPPRAETPTCSRGERSRGHAAVLRHPGLSAGSARSSSRTRPWSGSTTSWASCPDCGSGSSRRARRLHRRRNSWPMWGAPTEQPDHATLACRAALDMLEKLP